MSLQHLMSLGLVFQDNYSMFCTVVNKGNAIPQDDIVLRIINYLKRAQTAIHTKDLVKGVGLNNKKEINPLLYKLQQKGVVTKVNESPPMWQLGEQMVNNIDKTVKQTEPNFKQREDQTFVHNGLPNCVPKEIEYTKPLTPLGGRQKYKNGVKGLLPNNLSYEESSSANESTTEVNANNAYAEPNRSHMKNGNDLPDGMKGYHEASDSQGNSDLANMMGSMSMQSPKNNESSSSGKMGSSSSKSSSQDSEAQHVNGRSMGSRNGRQSNNESGNASRKAAAAAAKAAASKLPEQNSAAHYVNDVLNSDSFAALMKNPVSALYEYGQRNHIDTKVEIVLSEGPPHNPRWVIKIKL